MKTPQNLNESGLKNQTGLVFINYCLCALKNVQQIARNALKRKEAIDKQQNQTTPRYLARRKK